MRSPIRASLAFLVTAAAALGGSLGLAYTKAAKIAPEVCATAPKLRQAKQRHTAVTGRSYAGTPFKTSGNRAQRRRQLEGMIARNC